MTVLWDQAVDVLRESILAYAYVFNGNLGAGILTVTFLARLALMLATLRLARLTSAHQRVVQRFQPELDALKRRYANDPWRVHGRRRRSSRVRESRLCRSSGVLGLWLRLPY